MRDTFELRAQDAAGRVGALSVPRADETVTTPALMPVINPNLVTVDPERFASFGAQVAITNAYIIYGDDELRERALDEGVHDLVGFDGVLVTDSGSFQLASYGEIDVTSEEILAFQRDIGSDVGTPVDIPTDPDADRETAERDLRETAARVEAAAAMDTGDMLVNAPIQGSTYPDLRESAAETAYDTGLDVFPVGAVVPLLTAYRYAETVDVVAAAKRGLGADAPVHLFGAGHPMTFALAAALGCDLFDSAAYALYARDDRYLTARGTYHLADLTDLPCDCPVCVDHDADALRAMDDGDRETALAEHNLHESFAEMRRVRHAIREGTLLELVEERARAHPRLTDGYRTLLDHADRLERSDPASGATFFAVSAESARRPEVRRHHDRLARLDVPSDLLVTEGDPREGYDACWRVRPPFGPYPRSLAKTYPLNAETPARTDRASYEAAADGVAALVEANPDATVTLAHRGWPASALDRVPDGVARVDLSGGEPR